MPTSSREDFVNGLIGPTVAEYGDAVMERIVDEVIEALSDYRRGARFVFPTRTHVIQAKIR